MSFAVTEDALQFKIIDQDGSETPASIDVMLLHTACEACVKRNNLSVNDKGNYEPTTEFLQDLSQSISKLCGHPLGESAAYKLWCASGDALNGLKKNMHDIRTSLQPTE